MSIGAIWIIAIVVIGAVIAKRQAVPRFSGTLAEPNSRLYAITTADAVSV